MAVKFVDEARIYVKAGNGGKGCVSFMGIRGSIKKRPNGGMGGDGGNVLVVGSTNLNTLMDFRYQQHYQAPNGTPGSSSNLYGRTGADMIIQVPLGTVLTSESGEVFEITTTDIPVVLKAGGKGGRGNNGLKNPNIAVNHQGEVTEGEWFKLELKLMADVGIIGLPNAGKSSLLRKISGARPKVGDYPFTTLYPTLGVVSLEDGEKTFKVADIPGLIEGAHSGVGLGNRFLRHIDRVKVLVQLIDAAPKDHESVTDYCKRLGHDYQIIVDELAAHNRQLTRRPRLIGLNKIDLVSDKSYLTKLLTKLRAKKLPIILLSTTTGVGVDELLQEMAALLVASDEQES